MDSQLRILKAVADTVSRSLNVDEVICTALDALPKVTGHEISSLHLLDGDNETLRLRGHRGMSPRLRQVNRVLPVGKGLIGGVAATGEPVHSSNVGREPGLFPPVREAVRVDRLRGFVCVPIQSRGRILGTLSLARRTRREFTADEVALVRATGDQIGVALDNAGLYSEMRRQFREFKRAQAQLVHAERLSAIGGLAAGVAHEINNPLTTILGQSHLLLGDPDLPQPIRDRLKVIASETTRAARIVHNLLLFTRHHAPERRLCSLADQARRVLDLKGYQLQQDGIRIESEFVPCGPVLVDEHQIQQALLSLVQNAHEAMAKHPGDRVLTLRIGPVGDTARIDVLDTGPGIPSDVLPHIFDPFFTTKPSGLGSGLGLSVADGIVTGHNGQLKGGNRPEGGAAFSMELPFRKPAV